MTHCKDGTVDRDSICTSDHFLYHLSLISFHNNNLITTHYLKHLDSLIFAPTAGALLCTSRNTAPAAGAVLIYTDSRSLSQYILRMSYEKS